MNNKQKIYLVLHHVGMEPSTIITIFSKEEDAKQLVEMYNQTSEYGEYDYYSYYEEIVDEYKITDYKLESSKDDEDDEDEEPWVELINMVQQKEFEERNE